MKNKNISSLKNDNEINIIPKHCYNYIDNNTIKSSKVIEFAFNAYGNKVCLMSNKKVIDINKLFTDDKIAEMLLTLKK